MEDWLSLNFNTGWGTKGVLHIREPPSKIRMGPQRAVAAGSTSKFSGSTVQVIRACPPVSLKCSNFYKRHHSLDANTPQHSFCRCFSIPHFFNHKFRCFWFNSLCFFPFDFLNDGPDGQNISRPVWNIVAFSCPWNGCITQHWLNMGPCHFFFKKSTMIIDSFFDVKHSSITKWFRNYTNKAKKFKTWKIDTHTYKHFHTHTILWGSKYIHSNSAKVS